MNDLKAEFNKLAAQGYLGDPLGTDSYAYRRASSVRQVEEASSFPRQLESVHKAARPDSYTFLSISSTSTIDLQASSLSIGPPCSRCAMNKKCIHGLIT